jgi:large subunit ribosomal protein L28
MSRRCELTGKGPMVGKITASALRSVDHRGGLDGYLAKAKDTELSANALKVKKEIAKAQAPTA